MCVKGGSRLASTTASTAQHPHAHLTRVHELILLTMTLPQLMIRMASEQQPIDKRHVFLLLPLSSMSKWAQTSVRVFDR